MCDGPDLFLCVLAVLFPPIAVWVKRGICSADSFINIALLILGYLPGLIHAWYIISAYPSESYEPLAEEESQVHVYYVHGGPPPPSAGPGPGAHSTPQGSYGTIGSAQQAAKQAQYSLHSNTPTGSSSTEQPKSAVTKPQSQISPKSRAVDAEGGEGASDGPPPPSYSDVVKGDHKIQTDD